MLPETLADIQDVLYCHVEGFPQTYMGLPLSAEKLHLDVFTLLISKADKYLSGWRALLLYSTNVHRDELRIYVHNPRLLVSLI
jgi:hypothetical protein